MNKKIISMLLTCVLSSTMHLHTKEETKEEFSFTLNPFISQKITEYNKQKELEQRAYEEYLNPKFIKYDLTDEQVMGIASLCLQEQGCLEGICAEASLMANRYELYGQNYESLYSYVLNSGWFANASYYMSNCYNIDDEVFQLVYLVLNQGLRTLPAYVDNHDCLCDISTINTGSVYSQEDYIQNQTLICDVYGSNYTFYEFPAEGCDPFGYTSLDNKINMGDAHYDYQRVLEKVH